MEDIIAYGVSLLFLLASILLFSGKGSWLIAGYNTAPEKEKQKYDEKKLAVSTGLFTLVISLYIAAMEWTNNSTLVKLFPPTIIILVIILIIYMNTGCKKRSE